MTATLIVLLIITIAALIFLPFSKAVMKDRQELASNPLPQKFNIAISRVNQLMMNGNGKLTTFPDDPRLVNMMDENHRNMLIQFYYSTGTLTIILNYKFFQVELVKKMMFHDMRQAETFRQMDAANHFVEEAKIAIREHQKKVMGSQGYKNEGGSLHMSPGSPESELMPERAMFAEYGKEAKIELLQLACAVFRADGSSIAEFQSCPYLRHLLQTMQLSESELANITGENINFMTLGEIPLTVILMVLPPLTSYKPKNQELRASSFYHNLKYLGYSQEEVDNELTKMMLFAQQFGVV